MGYGITANYQEMAEAAREINKCAGEYQTNVNEIYSTIDKLKTDWEGEDNLRFVSATEEYRKDMLRLGEILNSFSAFLDQAQRSIAEDQDANTSDAAKL